ncbi:MAG: PQQ-binding-like beta-propeller repeat protein [Bacteroidales bacterium]|nr:PQQ-binding-like beta-propeller repeat protein [Bacteroidales bacterium]
MKKKIILPIVIVAIIVVAAVVLMTACSAPPEMVSRTKKIARKEAVTEVFFQSSENEIGTSENITSQWRGDNRDGIYNETGLLKKWAADGPELLWFRDELGDGYSSPAIANGKIYVTGLYADDLVLSIFDLNGKLLTRRVVGKEWNGSYPGARSTINVNDGKLYIYSSLGQLHCLDEETLNLIWKKDILNDFDGKNLTWGMTESPLIVDDKVFITPGGKTYNFVALNKHTGELIWHSAGEGTLSAYCSPQYIGGYENPIVVTSVEKYIIAFNAETGEKLWSYPQTNRHDIHPNTPIYSDGTIFSTTGYGNGSMLLRLKTGGKSVEQIWNNNADNQMGGAVKIGDYVYTSGHRNRGFYCIDWRTGEIKYKENQISPSAIIAADGMLYVYSERGEMALVEPNPDRFELVSSFSVTLGTNQHWAHPVILDGVLYIRHGDVLMAYKVKI